MNKKIRERLPNFSQQLWQQLKINLLLLISCISATISLMIFSRFLFFIGLGNLLSLFPNILLFIIFYLWHYGFLILSSKIPLFKTITQISRLHQLIFCFIYLISFYLII